MADPAQSIFHGARAEVWVNTASGDKQVGRAQNLSGSYNIINVALEEMGEATPQAIVTVGANVTFSVGSISKIGENLVDLGILPNMDTQSLIEFPELSFSVKDKITGKVKIKIEGAKPDGAQSFGGNPRSLFVDGMNFVARAIFFENGN